MALPLYRPPFQDLTGQDLALDLPRESERKLIEHFDPFRQLIGGDAVLQKLHNLLE
jgi:hypothetical protein